jgi:type IV pilus assembly protein PilB
LLSPSQHKTIASKHVTPSINLDQVTIDPEAVKLLTFDKARQYKVLPLNCSGECLKLAMVDPEDLGVIEDVALLTGMKVDPVMIGEAELDEALQHYSLLAVDTCLEDAIHSLHREMAFAGPGIAYDDETPDLAGDPLVRLVESFLTQAVTIGASDIHIEPLEQRLRIRMRIDGDLTETASLPLRATSPIVSRLKIISGLDIAEKRLPQDGRLAATIDNRQVSFRVSTIPSILGEKMVLRVLDQSRSLFSVDGLGLYGPNRRTFDRLLQRPHGLVLATGPTGSGKTSTLYAMLGQLNRPERNIMTLEDPVEYTLPGITQTQINPRVGLTFANGLRSLLRGDPDIIMVGEIRDAETADLAVHAALTGHLVLTTLHTTSAVGTVTRLLDMGIQPLLLASALSGVVSQRLVRSLCPHCREAYILSGAAAKNLGLTGESSQFFYRHTGCHLCRGTGYRGRLAIQEVMEVNNQIRDLMIQGAAEHEIESAVQSAGMVTLMEDGLEKAGRGITTIEEILKTLCLRC